MDILCRPRRCCNRNRHTLQTSIGSAKILPLFQAFVRDTADFWAENYGFVHRGAKPGPLSVIYPLFRDHILLQALTEIRAEITRKEGGNPTDLPPLHYIMKKSPRIRDGQPTPRAICGWVVR